VIEGRKRKQKKTIILAHKQQAQASTQHNTTKHNKTKQNTTQHNTTLPTYLAMAFFSTANTTQSFPWIPTTVDPRRTASIEYSTCNKCPSGLNTVIARSYDIIIIIIIIIINNFLSFSSSSLV
jgi:hypothetical protein